MIWSPKTWQRGFEVGCQHVWALVLPQLRQTAQQAETLGYQRATASLRAAYAAKEAQVIQRAGQHVTHAELARLRGQAHERWLEAQRTKDAQREARLKAQLDLLDALLQEVRSETLP